MANTLDEDDDLRRLKDWWRANGLALVLGALAGLALIGGWQGWQMYSERQALAASALFDRFEALRESQPQAEQLAALAQELQAGYSASPYASWAGLALADFLVQRQAYDQAIEQLQWVVDNADPPPLEHLARVRQARLMWAQGQGEAALKKLDVAYPVAFTPLYAELIGDIHADDGDAAEARSAYKKALATLPPAADGSALRRKLDNVSATSGAS